MTAAGRRTALVTGITGQDGYLLAEQLLARGYAVTGLARATADGTQRAADAVPAGVDVRHADLADPASLTEAVRATVPDELYHLAAPTFVPDSWERPVQTMAAIYGATATLLDAVARHAPGARTFVAGSGEMFGDAPESPQHEDTPCRPRSPYGTAKLAAHQLVGQRRDRDGLFVCGGILYNHESARRPARFVTRKITRAAAEIAAGAAEELVLGDTRAVRDWSDASDVMRGAWLALQQDAPADYVLCSGVGHTVAQFVAAAFDRVGLEPGAHVRVDPALVRPPEAVAPVGDPARARGQLGWTPEVSFEQLVARMVDADVAALRT